MTISGCTLCLPVTPVSVSLYIIYCMYSTLGYGGGGDVLPGREPPGGQSGDYQPQQSQTG